MKEKSLNLVSGNIQSTLLFIKSMAERPGLWTENKTKYAPFLLERANSHMCVGAKSRMITTMYFFLFIWTTPSSEFSFASSFFRRISNGRFVTLVFFFWTIPSCELAFATTRLKLLQNHWFHTKLCSIFIGTC